jgi:hypothetical protein
MANAEITTQAQSDEQVVALFASLANCERISDDQQPGSLSLAEIQQIGQMGLDLTEK